MLTILSFALLGALLAWTGRLFFSGIPVPFPFFGKPIRPSMGDVQSREINVMLGAVLGVTVGILAAFAIGIFVPPKFVAIEETALATCQNTDNGGYLVGVDVRSRKYLYCESDPDGIAHFKTMDADNGVNLDRRSNSGGKLVKLIRDFQERKMWLVAFPLYATRYEFVVPDDESSVRYF